jgi:hypothetical protein
MREIDYCYLSVVCVRCGSIVPLAEVDIDSRHEIPAALFSAECRACKYIGTYAAPDDVQVFGFTQRLRTFRADPVLSQLLVARAFVR